MSLVHESEDIWSHVTIHKIPTPLKKKKNTAYQTILGLEYTALNTV